MTLPPFTPDARCPKCGGEEVKMHYVSRRAALIVGSGSVAPDEPVPLVEHMRRTCTRCGYAWAEAPLDAEEGA